MDRPNPLPNVARANRALSAVWRSGLLPRPILDASHFEKVALRGAPIRALGADTGWREALQRLVEALRHEAELNPLGLAMSHGQVVMALRARMRAVRLWRRHPEILERPIVAPIIVLGQMRSGTTRLQRLLACDGRLAHTRMHESMTPVPQRGRRLRARVGLAMLRRLNPEIARIHPTAPSDPEEEFGLFSFSFGSAQFEAQWRVPSFSRWWEAADRGVMYAEFKSLLQTVGWARGEATDRPWILKAPQFLQDLPAVLGAFPDARLLCLERDLTQVVPSSASLVWNQMRIQSDDIDPHWVGREWLRKTRQREEMTQNTVAARPSLPRLHVGFEAMNRDWQAEMARIYDFLGLELTPELANRMTAYVAGARAHHGHRYGLADFGLSSEDIAVALPPRPARRES